jgi:hypothetical protein
MRAAEVSGSGLSNRNSQTKFPKQNSPNKNGAVIRAVLVHLAMRVPTSAREAQWQT